MNKIILRSLDEHRRVAEALAGTLSGPIEEAARIVVACCTSGGTVFAFGNGGSAADAQHFAAELVGRYVAERRALPAVALTTDTSILTAVANDYGYDNVFARQIEALGRPGDVALAVSTSGNSPTVLRALEVARAKGLKSVGLGGGMGGRMKDLVDVAIVVPSPVTARIQEAHITVLHVLCELVDAAVV